MSKPRDLETIKFAKSLYLKYTPINHIINASKLPRSTLMYHIPKWREERELLKSEILDSLTESKRELMSSIAKNGLEILAKSMQELASSGNPLTPKEMMGIANIVDSLDKITKLDNGQATDIITELKPSTVFEIRKMLKKDPFLEIEDVDCDEIDREFSREFIDDNNVSGDSITIDIEDSGDS